MNNTLKLVAQILIILVCILLLFINSLYVWVKFQTPREVHHLVDPTSGKDVYGLYYLNENFYCVFLGDRNATEVATTEAHEICHAMINHDPAHFCGRYGGVIE